jgi:hypothetical protein
VRKAAASLPARLRKSEQCLPSSSPSRHSLTRAASSWLVMDRNSPRWGSRCSSSALELRSYGAGLIQLAEAGLQPRKTPRGGSAADPLPALAAVPSLVSMRVTESGPTTRSGPEWTHCDTHDDKQAFESSCGKVSHAKSDALMRRDMKVITRNGFCCPSALSVAAVAAANDAGRGRSFGSDAAQRRRLAPAF